MTYLEFLLLFIIIPLIFFLILNLTQKSNNIYSFSPYLAIAGLSIIAFIYTTPWDNYLVAESIWFYDETLVTGLTIGWVPVEEYTFFIVQTILVGLIFLSIIKKIHFQKFSEQKNEYGNLIRWGSFLLTGFIWLPMFLVLILRSDPSLTYLSLMLAWGMIPISIQLIYGADIIWLNKKIVFGLIVILGTYLSIADALAIDQGIWTITLSSSTGILLGGILPIEEAVFFFLTTTLVVFGMVLLLEKNSIKRAKNLFNKI
ncbi:MAG: lycopene cyclase domain-containing protein [Candidatus Hodarchaeales archaeon]|jgi:putative membrane protein